jgi:signal transduction histidine kinase
VLVARAVIFVLCFTLTIVIPGQRIHTLSIGALFIVAVLASLPYPQSLLTSAIPFLEGLAATVIIVYSSPLSDILLPYLLVPALAIGIGRGFGGVTVSVVICGGILWLSTQPDLSSDAGLSQVSLVAQWLVVSLAVGLIASWAKRILVTSNDPDQAAYESAYRLLDQLRQVSRQLSVGLDARTLTESLLDDLLATMSATRGATYIPGDNTDFRALSARGVSPEQWVPLRSGDSIWAQAWSDGHIHANAHGLSVIEQDVFGAVIPLRVGERTIALIGLERANEPFTDEELAVARVSSGTYAVRLDAALLFSDIRLSATTEERRRLARDIHDGVAQELASLGYAIDDLGATQADPATSAGLSNLRREVTRIISELRLSIFDLRSDVSVGMSLNVALSEYVRSQAIGSHIQVHLFLQEAPERLSIDVEAELLRIVQEALANARKHARAENIWISSQIKPPLFDITVEDDGQGLGHGREDSYGLKIMSERAKRIGGSLEVGARDTGGTIVRVSRD